MATEAPSMKLDIETFARRWLEARPTLHQLRVRVRDDYLFDCITVELRAPTDRLTPDGEPVFNHVAKALEKLVIEQYRDDWANMMDATLRSATIELMLGVQPR